MNRIFGIDPGTSTGVTLWDADSQRFCLVQTLAVHRALELVADFARQWPDIPVIFEDARQRRWFGHTGPERLQGAGAAKRDATIWADFLTDKNIPHHARAPSSGSTGWNAERFRTLTKWSERTTEHSRDAGVLVYGFKPHEIPGVVRSWEQLRANASPRTQARR